MHGIPTVNHAKMCSSALPALLSPPRSIRPPTLFVVSIRIHHTIFSAPKYVSVPKIAHLPEFVTVGPQFRVVAKNSPNICSHCYISAALGAPTAIQQKYTSACRETYNTFVENLALLKRGATVPKMLSDEDVAIRSQKCSIRPCTFQCCSPCAGPRCASGPQPADQHEKIHPPCLQICKTKFHSGAGWQMIILPLPDSSVVRITQMTSYLAMTLCTPPFKFLPP